MKTPEARVVDNRTLLIAIDDIFRETLKERQAGELLACARETARALEVDPAGGPVEGYYGEAARLAEYFQLVRALQAVPATRRPEVEALPAFARLAQVLGSPIYGQRVTNSSLLPGCVDSLARVMTEMPPREWTIAAIAPRARARALADDDCSLVGLAARTGDLVMLAALAESAALEREVPLGIVPEPEYFWRVSDDLARAAARFVAHFHALFGETYPPLGPESAKAYWFAARHKTPFGRCVRIGTDPRGGSAPHYHWAIACPKMSRLPAWLRRALRHERDFRVVEFWSEEVWTTRRYEEKAYEDAYAELERAGR